MLVTPAPPREIAAMYRPDVVHAPRPRKSIPKNKVRYSSSSYVHSLIGAYQFTSEGTIPASGIYVVMDRGSAVFSGDVRASSAISDIRHAVPSLSRPRRFVEGFAKRNPGWIALDSAIDKVAEEYSSPEDMRCAHA